VVKGFVGGGTGATGGSWWRVEAQLRQSARREGQRQRGGRAAEEKRRRRGEAEVKQRS
jgi:hypothetical protein